MKTANQLFEFYDFDVHANSFGEKLFILKLSQPLPILKIRPSRKPSRVTEILLQKGYKTSSKTREVNNVNEVIVHECDFSNDKGFQIDYETKTGLYQGELKFDITYNNKVWLGSKTFNQYASECSAKDNLTRSLNFAETYNRLIKGI